jgi:hypothetical protein
MDELAGALRPRYVETPAKAGLYESLYLTAHHPTGAQALWIRHTVLKPPRAKPRASLWCTWFEGGGVRAGKVSTPGPVSTPHRPLQIADHGWIGVDGAVGAIDLEGLRASWDLKFKDPEPPMCHLPKQWMYKAPVPRTKSMSAAPMLRLSGALDVDGAAVDIDGWPCSIGHNWGAEHAERWIWVHADADSDQGPIWLDVVVGRVRLGPVTTPWIANGAVSIAGRRHRLGGLRPGAGTHVTEEDRGATVQLRGNDVAVDLQAHVDLPACVGWTYADPLGHISEVVNCSVTRTALQIQPTAGGAAIEVTAPVSAFEIGAPRRALDDEQQPFPD